MKVLFLNPSNAPYRDGFYKEFSKLIDVKFIHYFKDAYGAEGTNFEILKGEYNVPGYAKGFTPALAFKLWKEDYDVVINSDPCSFAAHIAYPIAKLRKKKFITWAELWQYPNTKPAKMIKPYIKKIIKGSDVCIAAGTKSKELLEKFGAKKIIIAPDASYDVTKLPKKKTKLPTKYILHVGDIREQKGIDIIIKAYKDFVRDGDIELIFVGREKELAFANACKRIAEGYPIHFKGFVPWQDIKIYYENCLFYVLGARAIPGVDPVQSWEMSLNEAMSASKPLISTDVVGGAFDMIHEGKNGYIVPQNDIKALTGAMRMLLSKDLNSMGYYSRRLYEKTFNHKNMARKFMEVIECLKIK